jgi:hypothetical protein
MSTSKRSRRTLQNFGHQLSSNTLLGDNYLFRPVLKSLFKVGAKLS